MVTIRDGGDTQTLPAERKQSNLLHSQVVGTQKLWGTSAFTHRLRSRASLALAPLTTSHMVEFPLNIYNSDHGEEAFVIHELFVQNYNTF